MSDWKELFSSTMVSLVCTIVIVHEVRRFEHNMGLRASTMQCAMTIAVLLMMSYLCARIRMYDQHMFFVSLSLFYIMAYTDFRIYSVYNLTNICFFACSAYVLVSNTDSYALPIVFLASVVLFRMTMNMIFSKETLGEGDILASGGAMNLVYAAFGEVMYIYYLLVISSVVGIMYYAITRKEMIPFVTCLFTAANILILWNP